MRRMIRSFFARFGRLIRFVVVGGSMALTYSLLTAALIAGPLSGHEIGASALGSLIVIPLSFLAHRRFTYADTVQSRASLRRFGLVALVSLGLNVGDMRLSQTLNWPYWTALVAGWGIIPLVNFLINTVWVFRAPKLLAVVPKATLTDLSAAMVQGRDA